MPFVVSRPITRSPGKLALFYISDGIEHQASVNFINGVDITNIAVIRSDATAMGFLVRDCLTGRSTVHSWGVLSNEGHPLYRESFGAPLAGTHAAAFGMKEYASATLKIEGRGVPTSIIDGNGLTSFTLYTRDAYALQPETLYLETPYDAPLDALILELNANLRFFADFYGQHADTTGRVAVQFHAHVQKRHGL